MRGLFHIHTSYSPDSNVTPRELAELAIKNKIDVLFVTDHDTIMGGVKTREYVKEHNLPIQVVTGVEVGTDIGDIIGIFLEKEIKSRSYKEVIAEIKEAGGVTVLPHPYKGHDLFDIHFLEDIDYVETFNSRTSREQDDAACKLAQKLGAQPICGADMHILPDFSSCYIEFNELEDIRKGTIRTVTGRKSKKWQISRSQMIMAGKTGDIKFYFEQGLRYLFNRITGR